MSIFKSHHSTHIISVDRISTLKREWDQCREVGVPRGWGRCAESRGAALLGVGGAAEKGLNEG